MHVDSASINALRRAGANIVGKTVTTEFAFVEPGPTTNLFCPCATPDGSSSGSAAAVGAVMVPAALGNQVVGSVIRPAGYCASFAIKPTHGALHCGEGLSLSQLHLGVHAASLEDMWAVVRAIPEDAVSDPGHPGLFGPAMVLWLAMAEALTPDDYRDALPCRRCSYYVELTATGARYGAADAVRRSQLQLSHWEPGKHCAQLVRPAHQPSAFHYSPSMV
jgi:Asp-tRNA(Asn)/Glu-tRNA(Gln) amidotransferase A subunit family amidase